MSILAKFKLTSKAMIHALDQNPVYTLEAVPSDDNAANHFTKGVPLGRLKLRVNNPSAQKELAEGDEYMVEITRISRRPKDGGC